MVTETAGVSGNLDSLILKISDAARVVRTVNVGADVIIASAGTNHLEDRGSLTVPMSTTFDVPLGCRALGLSVDAQFTDDRGNVVTSTGDADVVVRIPSLVAPLPGAVLDNGCRNFSDLMQWRFDWQSCPGADAYHLWVKGSTATIPVIDSAAFTDSEHTRESFGFVANQNRRGWRWRVRARYGTEWADWTPEQTFDVEPEDTDCS